MIGPTVKNMSMRYARAATVWLPAAWVLGPALAFAQPGPPGGGRPGDEKPPLVTGGTPPVGAEGGGAKSEEDSQTEAIRAVMDCVMFARRNRYYPFRASMSVRTKEPKTGRWSRGEPIYLDPVARWYEKGMTFITLTQSVGPEGGVDLLSRPHAVVAVPNSAFVAIPAAQSEQFNVSFLYRWGPDTLHTAVPVKLTRSMSFNYRYQMTKRLEAFTEPATNPRASRIEFDLYFTWDCEQDFRQALRSGMTRNEVLKRMAAEMEAWRQVMKRDGVEGVPDVMPQTGTIIPGTPPPNVPQLPPD